MYEAGVAGCLLSDSFPVVASVASVVDSLIFWGVSIVINANIDMMCRALQGSTTGIAKLVKVETPRMCSVDIIY